MGDQAEMWLCFSSASLSTAKVEGRLQLQHPEWLFNSGKFSSQWCNSWSYKTKDFWDWAPIFSQEHPWKESRFPFNPLYGDPWGTGRGGKKMGCADNIIQMTQFAFLPQKIRMWLSQTAYGLLCWAPFLGMLIAEKVVRQYFLLPSQTDYKKEMSAEGNPVCLTNGHLVIQAGSQFLLLWNEFMDKRHKVPLSEFTRHICIVHFNLCW